MSIKPPNRIALLAIIIKELECAVASGKAAWIAQAIREMKRAVK